MTTPTTAGLGRFNPVQPGARGMKIAATGLLVVMAAIFLAARAYEYAWPGLGYVKAFAEAAMVGGLADCSRHRLFRHPLGLPIPHTAIIPRNKDRIGEALAISSGKFPHPAGRRQRMRNIDVATAVGRFLQARRRARNPYPPWRVAAARRLFESPGRRGASAGWSNRPSRPHPGDGGLAFARPCFGLGDNEAGTCRCSRPPSRWTARALATMRA